MKKTLDNALEMQMIYDAAKNVYNGKYSVQYAISLLNDKVFATKASLKMYFNIYACMRNAQCYKMGTSEAFTKFLLNNIYSDFGKEVYYNALCAVKGNYLYRQSVNNPQPGLLRACYSSIEECNIDINFDEVPAAKFSYANQEKINEAPMKLYKSLEYGGTPIMQDNESVFTLGKKSQASRNTSSVGEIENNIDIFELNIQPAASILNVFSRLSYKPWYAIAEFVDNSTQSYISHQNELNNLQDFDKLIVEVRYNSDANVLTITDNAYGMEIERFQDAILLDSRNQTQLGRNEFGMGLKTAASWFGNVWKVTSTQYGSTNRYTATIDIPKLKEYGLNSIQIYRDYVLVNSHGTEIVIEQVTKKITGPRTIAKIRDLLSSMYRRDINNRDIEIWFNDEPIAFEEYPILTNFRGKSWKKELDFDVEFSGKKYNVTGFVAIMNPGSFPKAGFALFRQDRVVVGGTDNNYKPAPIFGQAQSQRSLKLFGELNMNDFPVNQAKDGFIWDDGLEDAFIDALKDNIQEYIEIAEMSIKERANEAQYSVETSAKLQQDVTEALSNAFNLEEKEDENSNETEQAGTALLKGGSIQSLDEVQEYIDTVLNEEVQEELVGSKRSYVVQTNPISSVHFSVQWAVGNRAYWIEYTEISKDNYEVLINIDHPFFMPYSKDESFKSVLEKFTLSFILAERQAALTSDKQGYIPTSTIKHYMNKFLEKLAED